MKILHVFIFFSLKHAGGTCDLIYKLARAQKQEGHDVTILTGDYKLDNEYAKSLEGVSIISSRSYLNSLRLYIMPGLFDEKKINFKNFDIIHFHAFRTFQNIAVYHYAKKYNIPYVIDAHGSAPRHTRRKALKRLFDNIFGYKMLRDSKKCIAETNVGIDEYKELGVKDNDIILIQPPFPVEDFVQLPSRGLFRDKFKIQDKKVIMFIGRINWIKGIDFLVEGFNELIKIRNDVILVIVGSDDGFKPKLDELIKKLNIEDKVLFAGFCSGRDKLSALVDADIVVQTSRYEQGAWAPIEAVLCDTPIIVSNNSGAGEDVKKMDAGYLVEWGNNTELRDRMNFILEHREEALSKTRKAKKFIRENLSMSSKIKEYGKLYSEFVKKA
ncbi:MAG: glycosyltransferase family 4 protein [bacterium]|nr:glycosyltransferase family 4 protein [bacterium]